MKDVSIILAFWLLFFWHRRAVAAPKFTATYSDEILARTQLAAAVVTTPTGELAMFGCGDTAGTVVDTYNFQTDEWQSTAALSQARGGAVATTVNGKLLFAGGFRSDRTDRDLSARVDIFTGATGKWTSGAWLSIPRKGLAAASAKTRAYFAGGIISRDFEPTVATTRIDVYNSGSDGWSTKALSLARYDLAGASAGGKILFAGGSTANNEVTDVVDMFDVSTGDRTSDLTLSQPRYDLCGTGIEPNLVLFAGGRDSSAVNVGNVVDIFNVNTKGRTVASLKSARWGLGCASMGTLALFAGGFYSNLVDIYDSGSDRWSVEHLSEARRFPAAAVVQGAFMAVGGTIDGGFSPGSTSRVDILALCQPGFRIDLAETACKSCGAGEFNSRAGLLTCQPCTVLH